jgi:hypothetical protein
MAQSHRDLIVWQKAMDLGTEISKMLTALRSRLQEGAA